MNEDKTIELYIDGSAITNPGESVGCAGIVKYPTHTELQDDHLSWSYNIGSSGSMELHALVNSLIWINKNIEYIKSFGIDRVVIFSDNQVVVSGANSFIYSWAKSGWKKANGGSIRNLDAWKKYVSERRKLRIRVDVKKIAGKSTEYTKSVDKLAKQAARSMSNKYDTNFTKLHIGRSLSKNKFKLTEVNANGQDMIIRVYAHGRVNRKKQTHYEIRFEEICECEVTGRYKAYTTKEIDAQIDRQHFYKIRLNNDESLPIITDIQEINSPLKD